MRLNILFGGKAGQGINKMTAVTANILAKIGYFTFNYRDYQSLIRGGHNFNILSVSNEKIQSHESKIDILIALDENTLSKHKAELKENGLVLKDSTVKTEKDIGRSLNMLYIGALIKILGIEEKILTEVIKEEFKDSEDNIEAAKLGYNQFENKFNLKKQENKIKILTGSEGISQGAINAGMDIYIAYPMTPATPVMHILASKQLKNNFIVFQAENEISVANAGLGASFAGAKTMIGTSGGGFDLMTEALSLQGISELPLVVYLSQRHGPGTGVPTYTLQADLNIALKGGHGEFSRIVIAPGDPIECIEKTNECFYFAEKFRALSILLADKHVAESEYSFTEIPKITKVKRNISEKTGIQKFYEITKDGNSPRFVLGKAIIKATSYEHDEYGFSTEDALFTKIMTDKRLIKTETIKNEIKNFQTFKLHKKGSKNIVVGWGSTKGAILDAIKDLDASFLQIIYLEPFPEEVKEILKKADKIILAENNATGMLGSLIAEKTGIIIKNKILRYDARPFESDTLKEQIEKYL